MSENTMENNKNADDIDQENTADEKSKETGNHSVRTDEGFLDRDLEISQEENVADEESFEKEALPTYEELTEEIVELRDQLLRAVAESENVRRRTERQKADSSKYAITNFARSILSVADNLTRALESVDPEARKADEELENLCIGIEMTRAELDNMYEGFEIKPIEALGEKFDHNLHQAMFEVEDPEKPAGTVVQQVQKGYTIHDRLLRPAMVGVSKGKNPGEGETETENQEEPDSDKAAKKTSSVYTKQEDPTKQDKTTTSHVDKQL